MLTRRAGLLKIGAREFTNAIPIKLQLDEGGIPMKEQNQPDYFDGLTLLLACVTATAR